VHGLQAWFNPLQKEYAGLQKETGSTMRLAEEHVEDALITLGL
jgi:hypothetical protein